MNYWAGDDQLACFTGAGSWRLEINKGSLNPQWEVIFDSRGRTQEEIGYGNGCQKSCDSSQWLSQEL